MAGMQTAKPAVLLCLAVAIFTAEACKTDDETVVVADAEAPPAVTTTPPTEPTPAATTPPTPVPVTPTPTTPTTVKDAGVTDAGKTDAGTVDAGKADAAAPTGGNFQACLAKCQAIGASCLTPQAGKDGGLPTLGDPTKCKAATDACQAACK